MTLDPWGLFWLASHAMSLSAIVLAVARARGVAGTLAGYGSTKIPTTAPHAASQPSVA